MCQQDLTSIACSKASELRRARVPGFTTDLRPSDVRSDMRFVQNRLDTFYSYGFPLWRLEWDCLANCGFSYTGKNCYIICFNCGAIADAEQFDGTDDLFGLHKTGCEETRMERVEPYE